MRRDADNERRSKERATDERVEELLQELGTVDLPPFYRTRLHARLREAGGRRQWRERLRSPGLAWSVAAVCVAALAFVAVRNVRVSPVEQTTPYAQLPTSSIDPITPADNSVVGAGDVEIVASIFPPIEGGIVRLYVDERDVTGLAEVTDSYIMYAPPDRFEEGEHIVTIEISDGAGLKLRDVSWLFYTLNGHERSFDPSI